MIKTLELTVLVENQPIGHGLLGEHGLAFHLRVDGRNVLFDTGQGLTLAHNAAALGIDLTSLDAIVLSTVITTIAADCPRSWRVVAQSIFTERRSDSR